MQKTHLLFEYYLFLQSLLKCEKAKLNRHVIPLGIVDFFCPLLVLNSSNQLYATVPLVSRAIKKGKSQLM